MEINEEPAPMRCGGLSIIISTFWGPVVRIGGREVAHPTGALWAGREIDSTTQPLKLWHQKS